MNKWHKGPPPSIGWWPASSEQDANAIRWWNGKFWSCPAYHFDTAHSASILAEMRSEQSNIKWTDRPEWWLERSKT